MLNSLTIDVEDYYQVAAFERLVKFEAWNKYPSRLEKNTYRCLEILAEHQTKATFFVLGWNAEQFPQLVHDIGKQGHEIACHGYAHKRIYYQSPEEFRGDVRKAKHILEDLTGTKIIGYRAPTYTITRKTLWALDILIEEGFKYDSSIFPIHHDRYGIPDAQRFPHFVQRNGVGSIVELPLSTVKLLGRNFPIAGGGYLRLLPLWLIKPAINKINNKEKQPVILYFHPWELDPGQPRLPIKGIARLRHYINIGKMQPKISNLLQSFNFVPTKILLKGLLEPAPS